MQTNSKKDYPADAKKLRAFMLNLRYCEYNTTRKLIVDACMIPAYTFANWLSGRARIPELAKQKINEVTGQQIF